MAMETSAADTPIRPTPKNKPTGFLSYANGNGGLKRHYPSAPAATSPPAAVSYRECMRNHAASMGGHALDGCCEFMPSPATFNPDDPTSLRCAACGCHRNFHRRDPDDPAPLHRHHPPAAAAAVGNGKKRHRTKFSEAQKERMREFSERLGWKMQKIERRVVDEFCNEIGVGREVLKVWMHNHKTTRNGNADIPSTAGADTHYGGFDVCVGAQFHHLLASSAADGSSTSSSSGFSL